jgi:thymidylate synthase
MLNKIKIVFNEQKEYKTIDDFTVEDITIEGYENYGEKITYPVAV